MKLNKKNARRKKKIHHDITFESTRNRKRRSFATDLHYKIHARRYKHYIHILVYVRFSMQPKSAEPFGTKPTNMTASLYSGAQTQIANSKKITKISASFYSNIPLIVSIHNGGAMVSAARRDHISAASLRFQTKKKN